MAQEEQDEIFRMLAAVLWIGNISYRENDEGNAEVADQSVVDFVAYLLEVDAALVQTALELELQAGAVMVDMLEDQPCVFLAGLYRAEQAIAERLDVLARDPGLRASMGRTGRERVLRRYSVDRLVGDVDALYRELLSSSSSITRR